MLYECLMRDFQRKFSVKNYRRESSLKVVRRNALKASLKDFDITMGLWEQIAKWRGLINNGAALYKEKRICEAERKRRERKANIDRLPADYIDLLYLQLAV